MTGRGRWKVRTLKRWNVKKQERRGCWAKAQRYRGKRWRHSVGMSLVEEGCGVARVPPLRASGKRWLFGRDDRKRRRLPPMVARQLPHLSLPSLMAQGKPRKMGHPRYTTQERGRRPTRQVCATREGLAA